MAEIGMCSHCGQPQAVKRDGTIWKHKDYGRGQTCVGSGRKRGDVVAPWTQHKDG